jgi:hypothetical protein
MGKIGFLLAIGPLLAMLGGWPLLYLYAEASMAPPDLEGWDYWSLVLSKMFNFTDAGWISLLSSTIIGVGCMLFVWGLVALVGEAVRRRTSDAP